MMIVPLLPLEKWHFHQYGQTYTTSVHDNYENSWMSQHKREHGSGFLIPIKTTMEI